MPAFEGAVGLGYRYVETDAHVTSDGICLAFHDDRLDRVTDRTGVIAELTYQAKEVESYTFKTFEAFFVATILSLVISFGIMLLGDWSARRTQIDAR